MPKETQAPLNKHEREGQERESAESDGVYLNGMERSRSGRLLILRPG